MVEDRRGAAETSVVPLRRYRLARLRLEDQPGRPEQRFEYLKRIHD